MKKFKELIFEGAFNKEIDFPDVTVTLEKYTLQLKFDSKDIIQNAGYLGELNPWLTSLCYMVLGKSLSEVSLFTWKSWEDQYRTEQLFWDLKFEEEDTFFNLALELLKAAADVYKGKEYLYEEKSLLVCRCFGVRESDIVSHLQETPNSSLETLATATKATMGCRSCLSQIAPWFEKKQDKLTDQPLLDPIICRCFKVKESDLFTHVKLEKNPSILTIGTSTKAGTNCKSCVKDLEKFLVPKDSKASPHFYLNRPNSEWILDIDYMLSCFPLALEWKMEVKSMKKSLVSISFDKSVTQLEEEKTAKELQDFLAASVDSGLTFFLRRARHFSKARG